MEFEDLTRLAKTNWVPLLLLMVLGGVLGGLAAMTQPVIYSSTATTTVVSGAEKSSVDAAYSITQAIRVTMPAYLAESTGTDVVDAASRASGLTTQQITSSLTTTSDPDSTVIEWTLKAASEASSQRALAAAVSEFQEVVSDSAPTSDAGRSLIAVRVNQQPAFDSASRPLSPLLAAAAGAVVGLGGGLLIGLLRMRGDRRVRSAESIELGLSIPVVAELTSERQDRLRAWAYVASYLAKNDVSEPVLVVTGRHPFSLADLKLVRAAVAASAMGRAPEVKAPFAADDPNLAAALLRSGAVIVALTNHVDDVAQLRSLVNSVTSVSPGPVFAVLDNARVSRLPVRATNAARHVIEDPVADSRGYAGDMRRDSR